MSALKEKLAQKIEALRAEATDLVKNHGDTPISGVTVAQAYGGMRGVKSLVTETSAVDINEGIRFRGYSIPELQTKLPRAEGGVQPLPEGLFYLLLTGEIPSDEEAAAVTRAWRSVEELPPQVSRVLDAMPKDAHPMTQLTQGILAMQTDSIFAKRYREGMSKVDYWDAMFDDTMLLLGRLPLIAAYIYRRTYKNGEHVSAAEPGMDWAANMAHMLGIDRPDFKKLMRLYLTIHADHEGGNVSAHATHLVGSALSDPYYSLAAGMCGLAGPLHGLANQEVMRWIVNVKAKLGGGVPTNAQLSEFLWETLNSGRVIPGFGHGVLRVTDPRYMAQRDFAFEHMPDDENFKIVQMLFDLVPDILMKHGKAKNPWPNVDAHSGCLLVHYGLVEYDFYTVLFGVSRAIGVLASLIWDRGLSLPLERPKSVTTEWIRAEVSKETKG